MNEDMQKHFQESLKKGVRLDGRDLLEFRDIEIEYGVSSTAHGSARVRAGNAELVAGVKIDTQTPYPDKPNEGSMMFSTEMTPASHRKFEGGPPGIDAIEAARVIDRTIRESGTIDTKSLCIEEGENVWFVMVDIMPVAYDGNMIDLGAIAAMAALQDARMPKLVDGKPQMEDLSDEKVPLSELPVAVTVFKYGDMLLIDPTEEEERAYDARMTVATLGNGKLCAIQKAGDASLSLEEIERVIEISLEHGKKIRKALKQ